MLRLVITYYCCFIDSAVYCDGAATAKNCFPSLCGPDLRCSSDPKDKKSFLVMHAQYRRDEQGFPFKKDQRQDAMQEVFNLWCRHD